MTFVLWLQLMTGYVVTCAVLLWCASKVLP
jgi:hypothetical protein